MRHTRVWLALLALAHAAPLSAQFADRARLSWRITESAHFRYVFPDSLAAWALPVASRMENVRTAVAALVGSAPRQRVTVVMDDPSTTSNGATFPELRAPTLLFLATPPDPRSGVGNHPGWGEILSVHEFAHAAHLTRPSRNPLDRLLYGSVLSPVSLGPIARRAPRWVDEGYATYVEGKLTGSGRPHGAWRAAVLREWALEGRLPSYGELDESSSYRGGSMAYLAGSAYLEWLVAQRGDSALPHLWRRLSARRKRTFAAAFSGVFAGTPAGLYGRFSAEVTDRAFQAKRRLEAEGLVVGDTVQALTWQTGDPALSPDGSRMAIVLRSRDYPSRVVIWNTAEPTDTAEARADRELLARDPEDVPPLRWRPRPKRDLATLWAAYGSWEYAEPRFLPDGRRVLLTRAEAFPDGAILPDLFIWDPRTGEVSRVTHGAAIVAADPTPDGRAAIGVQCRWGRCGLVRVELATGAVRTITAGSPDVVYARPRVSLDGRRVAAAAQRDGVWRIVLLDPDGGERREVGPDDGASRYHPAFLRDGSGLVVTSEAGGIPNLEVLDTAASATRPITRVVGAAMAPEPAPDGRVYFLRLHATGLELASVPAGARIGPTVALDSALTPAAPLPREPGSSFAPGPLPEPRAYGLGPHGWRLLPSVGIVGSGVSAGLAVELADPVGRLGGLLQGEVGAATWQGASARAIYRGSLPEIEGGLFTARYRPDAAPDAGRLSVDYRGASADLRLDRSGLGSSFRVRLGGSVGAIGDPDAARDSDDPGGDIVGSAARASRDLGFVELAEALAAGLGPSRLEAGAALHGSAGTTAEQRWTRALLTGELRVRPAGSELGVAFDALYARERGGPAVEQLAVGGARPPFFDPALFSQQIAMPGLRAGTLVGGEVTTLRARLTGFAALSPYAWAGRSDLSGGWLRVVGLEQELVTEPVPLLRLPGVQAVTGIAYSLDEKPRRAVRVYGAITLRP